MAKDLTASRQIRAGKAAPGGSTPTGDPASKYKPGAAKGGPHPHPAVIRQLTPRKRGGR